MLAMGTLLCYLQQSTSPGGSSHGYSGDGSFAHDRLDWLKKENRKCVIIVIVIIISDVSRLFGLVGTLLTS